VGQVRYIVVVSILLATAGLGHGAAASEPRATVARACGTEHIFRITGTISATGISCQRARGVFRAVEIAPLPSDVAATPYFHWSPPYKVSTPSGRFTCQRNPHGLAGSEHKIRCNRGNAHVSWDTVHD
jgi:hypothetical protein